MFNLSFISFANFFKRNYAASVVAVLERFGQINVVQELNEAQVHRLENILTLSMEVHEWFDKLFLWLEKDPNVNFTTVLFDLTSDLFFRTLQTLIDQSQLTLNFSSMIYL